MQKIIKNKFAVPGRFSLTFFAEHGKLILISHTTRKDERQ